jgi:predicted PolB exonuclease-like 3'-5' exonuclease
MEQRSPKRTDQELAKIVNDYIEKYPNTTRNRIKIATDINNYKLEDLEALGLIKLPKKVKPGSHSKTWRFYKT